MENQTFISCLAWIHRGFATKVPLQVQIPEDEIQRIKQDPLVDEQLQKQKAQLLASQMQNQQDDEDDLPVFAQDIKNLQKGQYPDMVDDLENDQKQDYYIKQTDLLIVTGKIENQFSSLQVYVYEQQNNNLFVHHEIMLSSFPLALEWLNVQIGSINLNQHNKGNFAIVSTFLPQIQIWNLDVAQSVQPDLILGGQITSTKKKPKKFTNNAKKFKQGSHTDSVLGLSLNPFYKNILASASADQSVKIWDLEKTKNIYTANHHKGRVNKIKWSSSDSSIIFTASQDRTISILDSRYPNDRLIHTLKGKDTLIQSACWNINRPTEICYTTDEGNLHIFDVRSSDKILASISAHKGSSITDVKIGTKNMCYTCSQDQSVKIWNLNKLEEPIGFRKPNCGKMYCMDLIQTDQGPIITCGNGKGQLFVWDVTQNQHINSYWRSI